MAEKFSDHKAWWTPLADGKMFLFLLMIMLFVIRCILGDLDNFLLAP